MQFGQSILRFKTTRFLSVITLTILGVSYLLYVSRDSLTFALIYLGPLVLIDIFLLRNSDKPIFEIKDDILYVKTYWGFIKKYPIRNFGGRIETFKVLFKEYLEVPGFYKSGARLDLNRLNKAERKRFIDYLKKQVEKSTEQLVAANRLESGLLLNPDV